MMLTGHVSITNKEIAYVNDALTNGWDEHHDNYIRRFEEAFAKYVGVKYARSVSGGTQALTLALATLNLKQGDEVILPDITYFACSDVIVLQGATPVFVDVDKTWCMDPQKFEEAITPNTKAVMPVWLYGNAPEMDQIMKIGKKHNISVVEDACPAVGTFYQKKHAGSFGDFGCFSFHGAKIMTTGFGVMIVTNNKKLYDRMIHLSDHGEDKKKSFRFWQTDVGYTFDLPNINCALGLAQLERIEEFVEKKRKIFSWYKKYLGGLYEMNYEQPYARTNKWLTSIIVPYRDELAKLLKKKDVDTRPFFFPISMFPMYKEQNTREAHRIGLNGISLPSGVNRMEYEIKYISNLIYES